MGLDIWFNKVNAEEETKALKEVEGKDNAFWLGYIKDVFFCSGRADAELLEKYLDSAKASYVADKSTEELAYFRKVNFLMSYFDYKVNREDKEISKDEIESFIADCAKELECQGTNEEGPLQPKDGFFYGSCNKDEWFYISVQNAKETFEKILEEVDWNKERVIMHAWW